MRGSTVMVACTPSKARPPWLETQTASSPTLMAIAATFADCTPLGITGRPDSCLIHSRSFQSRSRLRVLIIFSPVAKSTPRGVLPRPSDAGVTKPLRMFSSRG